MISEKIDLYQTCARLGFYGSWSRRKDISVVSESEVHNFSFQVLYNVCLVCVCACDLQAETVKRSSDNSSAGVLLLYYYLCHSYCLVLCSFNC